MSKSKVVVITGASSRIGKATAKELAQQGNTVRLAARKKQRQAMDSFYDTTAIPVETSINEILLRPTAQIL